MIEHKGIVESINDGIIKVKIVSSSACLSCYAKGTCPVSESVNKIIEVKNLGEDYSVNDQVKVILQESSGFYALFFGYLLPFLILIITLPTVLNFTKNELASGIISLAVLFPYYLSLYFFRDKLKKVFSFKIQKLVAS